MIEICPVCHFYSFSRAGATSHYDKHVRKGELQRGVFFAGTKGYTGYRQSDDTPYWVTGYQYDGKPDTLPTIKNT